MTERCNADLPLDDASTGAFRDPVTPAVPEALATAGGKEVLPAEW
jgi:hypothetical protein